MAMCYKSNISLFDFYCFSSASWCGKSRMVALPVSEISLRITLLVLMQYANVTDGRTDGRTSRHGIDCAMHSVAQQKTTTVLDSQRVIL